MRRLPIAQPSFLPEVAPARAEAPKPKPKAWLTLFTDAEAQAVADRFGIGTTIADPKATS